MLGKTDRVNIGTANGCDLFAKLPVTGIAQAHFISEPRARTCGRPGKLSKTVNGHSVDATVLDAQHALPKCAVRLGMGMNRASRHCTSWLVPQAPRMSEPSKANIPHAS